MPEEEWVVQKKKKKNPQNDSNLLISNQIIDTIDSGWNQSSKTLIQENLGDNSLQMTGIINLVFIFLFH